MDPTEFRYSPKSTLLYLAASVVAAAVTARVAQHANPNQADALRLLTALFALSAVVFAWLIARPRRVALDNNGFEVGGGFTWRSRKILWGDVDEFFLSRIGKGGGRAICFYFKRKRHDPSHLADDVPEARVMGTLPLGWDEPPEEMVREFNSWRERALSGAQPAC